MAQQPKSNSVRPKWAFRLSTLFSKVAEMMFLCNSVYFFEKFEKFLNEFKDIQFLIPDENFIETFKKGPFVCNGLFFGILENRLLGPKKNLALYLEDKKLQAYLLPPIKPMEERSFWAIWYACTVDPQKGVLLPLILPLNFSKEKRYHLTFLLESTVIYVTFEYKDEKWHYIANYHSFLGEVDDGQGLYLALSKK